MSEWECGVCGYLHKEEQAPEKCPICEAPEKMFNQSKSDAEVEPQGEAKVETEVPEASAEPDVPVEQAPLPEKQWRCTISGYLHTGVEPPEKCPVCEATADQFEEVVELENIEVAKEIVDVESSRRWRCSVCGYVHNGENPPEKCPLCGADASLFEEIDTEGKVLGRKDEEPVEQDSVKSPAEKPADAQEESTFFNTIASVILKFHLHPIHTHFPNGILPVMVAFLALGIFFNIGSLETAAFYNNIAVLIVLPVVIFTGYIEWQKRYMGLKSAIFITKILCSLIVLASVNVLVFWRVIDPTVAADGSSTQMIYLAVAGVALAAAGIAGHLGGKLAFAGRH